MEEDPSIDTFKAAHRYNPNEATADNAAECKQSKTANIRTSKDTYISKGAGERLHGMTGKPGTQLERESNGAYENLYLYI